MVPRRWFGTRQDCVAVKTSNSEAIQAWKLAHPENRELEPDAVLTFFVSLKRFQAWIDNEKMKKCHPNVGGYRIYKDVDLNSVDPDFRVHPIERG